MAMCALNNRLLARLFGAALVVTVVGLAGPSVAQTAKNNGTTSGSAVYNSTKSSGNATAPTGGVYNSTKRESGASPLFTKRETAGALPSGNPSGKTYGMKGTQVSKPVDPNTLYKDNQAAKAARARPRRAARRPLPPSRTQQLPLRQHAAGVGEPSPVPVVRLMMALKLASLAQGASGIRPATLALQIGRAHV